MFIIKYRKIFYTLSILITVFSLFAVFFWGIKFGIDFTGGSILEFKHTQEELNKTDFENNLRESEVELGEFSLREIGEDGLILRTRNISEEEKDQVLLSLSQVSEIEEIRFNNVGPTLGQELKSKAVVAILIVILAIVLFIAFIFRHVSKPVSSWNYGFITIIAFLHDVIIPIGLFAVLGHFGGIEVDTLFIIAILVVLGYSINDTIVVFDRVRENLAKKDEKVRDSEFEEVVGSSLRESITRSINTSLTTILALVAIYFIGAEVTKWFSLAMIVGVLAGTYSSIFLAAPLLITLKNRKDKKAKKLVN